MFSMSDFFIRLHAYVINPFLNFLPFFWVDIFYDNQTYIGNTLHKPIYLIMWGISSSIGFYIYSKKIWNHYNIHFHPFMHILSCLGMCISCVIPYSNLLPGWVNDLHIWLAIASVTCFIFEWLWHSIPQWKGGIDYQKNFKIFLYINLICLCITFAPGHITSICEITFSFFINFFLAKWTLKLKKR